MLRTPSDLPSDCLEFRRSHEAGQSHPHLDECSDCRSFAEFVGGLRQLGVHTPLADELRGRLRGLPEAEERRQFAIPQVPMLPLPAALERRLKRIARVASRPREAPLWIRSPRFAVAASYLLTVIFAGTLGNPAAWGQSDATSLAPVNAVLESAQVGGRATWRSIEGRAAEGYARTKEFYRTSRSSLEARWLEFVDSINDKETTDESDGAPGYDASS
jgi:hypothetical protein